MPWPCWPSHQSLLTALAQRSAQFPQCWVLITHARSDKCPRLHVAALSRRTSPGRPEETDRLGVWMSVWEPLPSNPYLGPSLLSGLISFSLTCLTLVVFGSSASLLLAEGTGPALTCRLKWIRRAKWEELKIKVHKKVSSVINLLVHNFIHLTRV